MHLSAAIVLVKRKKVKQMKCDDLILVCRYRKGRVILIVSTQVSNRRLESFDVLRFDAMQNAKFVEST